MADLVPSKNHNIIANLNEHHEDAADFVQVIRFLKRSEIHHALTAEVDIYTNQIREFWTHAEFRIKNDRRVILSKVQGQRIEIAESSIRFVLRFKSEEHTTLSNPDLYSLIDRMGYEGDRNATKLVKGQVSYLWRYLWHVVIHVFAARSSGWDNLNRELAVAICCLCTNKPYNWAGMIFEFMRKNANDTLKSKLFLYPRFLQLIINYKLKDLSHEGHILELVVMRNRVFKDMKSVHPKSTFSGRFTDIFNNMKSFMPREAVREEEVIVEDVDEEESEEESREFDPRIKRMVK